MSKIFKEIPIDSVKADPMEKHWVIEKIEKLEIKDRDNDVIIMTFDPDKYHLHEAAAVFQAVEKKFPNHNFIGTAKGIEFSVEAIDSMIAQLKQLKEKNKYV